MPEITQLAASCQACGAEINDQVSRTTERLLASLDPIRRELLRDTYQGPPPARLCAECLNRTVSVLNGVGAHG